MTNLAGSTLGQYQLIDILGRGSTSTVYKAYQPSLDRYVAVKVLLQHLAPQLETRFVREARAVAQLQHPNILPIYDFGQHGSHTFFVMQYVESEQTLGDLLARRPALPLALQLVSLLLAGLNYAHGRGIVHRDIKPSNVLLPQPDWPLLADFGIAHITDANERLTPVGQVVGTAIYIAPEQAQAMPSDARADLYATGVVLYELATGRVPFSGTKPGDILMQHVHDAPPSPRQFNPRLPPYVEAVILRALEKEPDQRYQSAAEMRVAVLDALDRLAQEGDSAYATVLLPPDEDIHNAPTPPAPVLPRAPAPGNNRRAVVIIAGLLALLALLGTLWVGNALLNASSATGAAQSAEIAQSTPVASPPPSAIASTPAAIAQDGSQQYVVQPGDTLSDLATRFGTTVEAILAANGLSDPNTIQAGQSLIIPPPGTVAAAPTPLAATATVPEASPTRLPPTAIVASDNRPVLLEDSVWQGGYGRSYGGRTATWIYGSATEYSTMSARLELAAQPNGTATLSIEGMDSEGGTKTPIRITVNGTPIYEGPNPLPDDDIPLETGTWATHAFTFDAALLQIGTNEIAISNEAQGAFSLPPFLMLDYAEVIVSDQ